MRERRQEQISKIVANQTVPGAEPILKQPAQQRFVFRERDHAVADIPRGQDAVFAAQPAGTASVVGDGDDGGEIHDGTLACWIRIVARRDVELKTAKEGGQSGAAAERDHTKSPLRVSLSALRLACEDANPFLRDLRSIAR